MILRLGEPYLTDSFEVKKIVGDLKFGKPRRDRCTQWTPEASHKYSARHTIGIISYRYGNTRMSPVLNDMHTLSRHNELVLWG